MSRTGLKYRRLTTTELEPLKPDFISFLASQGIEGPEWEQMKSNEAEKAEGLLDIFSDVVWQKVLEKTDYLEFETAFEYRIMHFKEQHAEAIILKPESGSLKESMVDIKAGKPIESSGLSIYRGSRPYKKLREQELFAEIESGAVPCNSEFFNRLKQSLL